jgi:magnesium-transporting ATPase (P-type)
VFNLLFTVVPPFAFGCFNQDLPQEVVLLNPELYPVADDWMRGRHFGSTILLAIYQSLVSYYSVRWNLRDDSLEAAGVMCYLTVVFIVIAQIICWTSSHNAITLTAYCVNILAVPFVCFIYMGLVDMKMRGVLVGELAHVYPWLGMIIAIDAALLPEFIVRTIVNKFRPSTTRLWSERVRFERMQTEALRKEPVETRWIEMIIPSTVQNS